MGRYRPPRRRGSPYITPEGEATLDDDLFDVVDVRPGIGEQPQQPGGDAGMIGPGDLNEDRLVFGHWSAPADFESTLLGPWG